MPRFEVDGRALSFTIRNFSGSIQRIRKAAATATALGGSKILAAIQKNVSVPAIGGSARSHSAALREQGGPYSTRHGNIQITPSGGVPGFSRKTLLVHTVSGDLLSAISGKFNQSKLTYTIETDLQKAPHLRYVLRGTRVMLPRDILWATATDPVVVKEVRQSVIFVMGRAFRTQSGIRFG